MEFRATDHMSEKQLKLDVIAVYNHRLDEREKRKKFVIEHNLLDYKKQQMGGKKRLRVSVIRVPILRTWYLVRCCCMKKKIEFCF